MAKNWLCLCYINKYYCYSRYEISGPKSPALKSVVREHDAKT